MKKTFTYRKTTFILLTLLSIIIAFFVWNISKNHYDQMIENHFEANVLDNIDNIDKRMSSYQNILQSGIGFFHGSNKVTRQEWHDFIESINIKKNYSGLQGVGYAVMIDPLRYQNIEKQIRHEGYKDFTITPKDLKEHYSTILYLEPLDQRNREAIGYDMFSEPVRREAMEKARDTGLPSISGRVTLVQEIDSDIQPGMLIYLPLYKKGAALDTIQARRQAHLGFVYSPIRMNDLMDKIVLEKKILRFEIYDSDEQNPDHLLYRSFTALDYVPLHKTSKKLKVNNRTWHINFYTTPEFETSFSNKQPLLMTLAGLAVYFFLLGIILILIKGRHYLTLQATTLNKLTQALEQSPSATIITNLDGEIEYVNTAFNLTTGYTKEEVIGQRPAILKSGKTSEETYEAMWQSLTSGCHWQGEFINKRKDGSEYVEAVNASPIVEADGKTTHYMAVKEDITDKKHSQERIHHLANFDALTGLPNRFQLDQQIKYTINAAKRNKDQFTLMFLDLDHFKDINDTLGHSTGDALLVEIANRFQSILREVDTVSRFGGDEFIFLLPHTNAEGIVHVAQKILHTIEKPVNIDHNELIVTASIGIAVFPDDGNDAETLSKNADTAMYRAKMDGRNNFSFYTQLMQERSTRNLQLTHALHYALERKEFYLLYQPQLSLQENRVIGVEALIRWRHPLFGEISPAEFIPLAEEGGMILSIGEWVLQEAISQAKGWRDQNLAPVTMAVNLSAIQFRQPKLVENITKILDDYSLPAEYLELELTESLAMHDPQQAYMIMNNLHSLGIRIAIDDFGTGYSSLSYLKKFKLSKLKIDQSFIRDILSDDEDKTIVSAIIKMAHSLGLKTIAEGVETLEQLEYLKEQGCDKIQGFYFSRPISSEKVVELLRTQDLADKKLA